MSKLELQRIIDKLLMMTIFLDKPYRNLGHHVGKLVEKLTDEEREILKTAKAEDFYHVWAMNPNNWKK